MSATLLPVLVKCCVLSKRQPRMCQPSHLTLPNGLLNADIKLTRSFALPLSSLSPLRSHYLSFSPCPSPCHSLVLSLLSHPRSVGLSINLTLPPPLLSLDSFEPSLQLLIPEAFFFFTGCLFTDPLFKKKKMNSTSSSMCSSFC